MILLAVAGGLLLTLALIVREYQLARERTVQAETYDQVRQALDIARTQLRRTREDLYVLRVVLEERHLVDEAELARSRMRLIENPRRIAQERDQILRNMEASPTQLVIDDGESVH